VNKYERRLFCECGYSVYDNGFQSNFFRHHQPCRDCGRPWNPTAKNVRWQEGELKRNPTLLQRVFGVREAGKFVERTEP
jgi:hypothetical protein